MKKRTAFQINGLKFIYTEIRTKTEKEKNQ